MITACSNLLGITLSIKSFSVLMCRLIILGFQEMNCASPFSLRFPNAAFIMGALEPETWKPNPAKYPSGLNATVEWLKRAGVGVGLHTLPYAPTTCTGTCAQNAFVPEGLAPTYRSGSWGRLGQDIPTEDLGFWWGHEGAGTLAQNGNPTENWYGFECPQLVPGKCR